jgi:hypothetical protein
MTSPEQDAELAYRQWVQEQQTGPVSVTPDDPPAARQLAKAEGRFLEESPWSRRVRGGAPDAEHVLREAARQGVPVNYENKEK